MAARTDKQDWVWVPGASLGPIRFGAPLPQGTPLAFRKDPEASNEHEDVYDVLTHGVCVNVDPKSGLVAEVMSWDSVRYRGTELIGHTYDEVKAIVGGDWQILYPGELDIRAELSLGIAVFVEDEPGDNAAGANVGSMQVKSILLWNDEFGGPARARRLSESATEEDEPIDPYAGQVRRRTWQIAEKKTSLREQESQGPERLFWRQYGRQTCALARDDECSRRPYDPYASHRTSAAAERSSSLWTPRVSLGPFAFGERLDVERIGVRLEPAREIYALDPRRAHHAAPDTGIEVVADHGIIAFARAWERIAYGSHDLIGLPPAEAAALIGGVWDGPIDCRDGSFRHICNTEGIVLWSRDGAVEFASVRKPYAWDWVPNERVGEIRFGAPLPEGPSLAFRKVPERSNDEETCYDVVTHGVDVRVDPKTGMVNEIGTSDSLRYRGKELIGRTFAEVKAIVGGDWDVVGIGEPDIQIVEALGISVILDDEDPEIVFAIRLDADAVLAKGGA